MSALKPLKCSDRYAQMPIKNEELDLTREVLFRKCEPRDKMYLYGYKGFSKDENELLRGSGKLIYKPR